MRSNLSDQVTEDTLAREYFCAYFSLIESLKPLSDAAKGRLFMAALEYSAFEKEPELKGNEKILWPTIRQTIDRDKKAYEDKCRINRENGCRANRSKKEQTAANGTQEKEKEKEKEKEEDKEEEEYKDKYEEKEITPSSNKTQKVCIHSLGKYGWVKLTEDQYAKLLGDLGKEELERCIAYIDEQAQKSGNKNRWTDWDLVIRSCSRDGWGIRGSQVKSSVPGKPNADAVLAFLAESGHIPPGQ